MSVSTAPAIHSVRDYEYVRYLFVLLLINLNTYQNNYISEHPVRVSEPT